MRASGWALIQYDYYLYKNWYTKKNAREIQREDDQPSTCQEERALKKPDDPII